MNHILTYAGKVSHEIALLKVNDEFDIFPEHTKNELSQVERHFIESIDRTVPKLKERKVYFDTGVPCDRFGIRNVTIMI